MRALVVGSGGREHALAWKLAASASVDGLFIAPGNGGTSLVGDNVPIDPIEIVRLAEFARDTKVDLVVIGPELPLSLGLVDELRQLGILAFGPSKLAAQIEASKAFAKEFMAKYGIPTARFELAASVYEAEQAIQKIGTPCVIKADGLAGGKGAFIVDDPKDAMTVARGLIEERLLGDAGKIVVVEEFLTGIEASFQVITDGHRILPLATSQDHKRVYDNDEGPNTGGMGAYSPAFFITPEMHHRIMQEIMKPAIQALDREGRTYTGVLYGGLMLTREGPKVLEFNCRFGDPEIQAVIPRMEVDFFDLCDATARGELNRVEVHWKRESCLCVVLTSGGYPGKYEKGFPIEGLDQVGDENILVFHAGTKRDEQGRFITTGGRVLNIVALGSTLQDAYDRAYEAVKKVHFQNMHYRKDIGMKAIKMMQDLARTLKQFPPSEAG